MLWTGSHCTCSFSIYCIIVFGGGAGDTSFGAATGGTAKIIYQLKINHYLNFFREINFTNKYSLCFQVGISNQVYYLPGAGSVWTSTSTLGGGGGGSGSDWGGGGGGTSCCGGGGGGGGATATRMKFCNT